MARDLVDILMDKGAVQMILGYGWTIWKVWAANSWNGRTPGRQWWFHGERYNHVQCPGMCSSFRVLKMILLVKFGRSLRRIVQIVETRFRYAAENPAYPAPARSTFPQMHAAGSLIS